MTQAAIDAIDYPPTHTYRLEGPEPTDVLARRVEILNTTAPGFFVGARRFLDIGANKGFFTLLAVKTCQHVTALEPDRKCAAVLKNFVGPNVEVVEDLTKPKEPFDRIWIGNAHHYLFRDARGWGWVERVAALCAGELLVEGPDGMDCPDMAACIPPELQSRFTRPQWLGNLETWFDVLCEVPADPYTPGRYIWHCKKRKEPALFGERVLIPLYRAMMPYIRPTDVVIELGVRDDRGKLSREMFDCAEFIGIDRNPERVELAGGGQVIDVLLEPMPRADVVITTALFHHTGPTVVPLLMAKLCAAARRTLLISGPDVRLQPLSFGDHRWHLDAEVLIDLAAQNGFHLNDKQQVGHGDVFLAFTCD